MLREYIELLHKAIGSPEVWAIVTALRGPDSMNSELKWIFTARIRALVGVSTANIVTEVRYSRKIPFSSIIDALVSIGSVDCHYLWHVFQAIHALTELDYADPKELAFLRELASAMLNIACYDRHIDSQIDAMDSIAELIADYTDYIDYDIEEPAHA